MRHPILITKDDFDFTADRLQVQDFEDEFERSKVYDTTTKEKLARILIQQVNLFVALTDALVLMFPHDGARGMSFARGTEVSKCVYQSKQRLDGWYIDTGLELPEKALSMMAAPGSWKGREASHESIFLYTNLVLMYYYTAHMILYNYEVLHLCVFQRPPDISQSSIAVIYDSLHGLQDAV
jgi:hypothetical protein